MRRCPANGWPTWFAATHGSSSSARRTTAAWRSISSSSSVRTSSSSTFRCRSSTAFEVIAALDDDVLPAIVFVTAYDAYAIRAFEVDAIDYLLKPVNAERFDAAVSRVVGRLHDAQPSSEAAVRTLASRASETRGAPLVRFVARRGAKHYFIRTDDVDWIEADGNYLRLWTGDRSHLVRETMKAAEERLDAASFVRIHRSTIVAIDRIESIQAQDNGDYVVTMRGGTKLASSRGYADRIRGLLSS